MKRFVMLALVIAVVAVGFACGQEPQQPNEHLKGFAPFIGSWEYEGPIGEDGPLADKDTKMVVQISWTWILDKQAILSDWSIEFENGTKLAGKGLTGWNAVEKKITNSGMNSLGGMGLGTDVIDEEEKTITSTSEGADPDGKRTSMKTVIKMKDKDTLTWQAVERTGGDVEGPSPVYEFKRVKRAKGKK
jgi:hypothetical protein